MGQPLSYEPESTNNIAALAARENRDPREVVYDLMLEKNGQAFFWYDRSRDAGAQDESRCECD